MGEFSYNTNFQMFIGMSPLKEIYGYDASAFIEHIFCDSRTPKAKVWTE